mgnify:CR=1 FL=1
MFSCLKRHQHDLFAQLTIAHALKLCGFGNEAVGGHAGQGVDLQTPGVSVLIQDKVGTGIDGKTERLVKFQQQQEQMCVLFRSHK